VKVIGNLRSTEQPPDVDTEAARPAPGAERTATSTPESVATPPADRGPAVTEPAALLGSDTTAEAIVTSVRTPAEAELAIPAYNSLAASQVVSRLEGLTAAELEAVRRYEEAHRGRRTVLGKIALLQSPSS
jgi:hypothetical protein